MRAPEKRRWKGWFVALMAFAALSGPVVADSERSWGGRRGGPDAAEPGGSAERRERRDGFGAGDRIPAERREAMRQRWQELSPAERDAIRERRRQMRQLSPEERQQLRRDILEANRFRDR